MINVNGKQITVSTNEIYQLTCLKVFVLNRSTKGAMAGSLCKAPYSLPSISKKVSKTKTFKQITVTTNNIYH